MLKTITIQLKVEWLHCRPTCPIEEVSYLKDLHRHIFHIRCRKTVSHNDRDVEIIQFKHDVELYLSQYRSDINRCCVFGSRSCEDIAEELILNFWLTQCEVLEDWENWATLSVE